MVAKAELKAAILRSRNQPLPTREFNPPKNLTSWQNFFSESEA